MSIVPTQMYSENIVMPDIDPIIISNLNTVELYQLSQVNKYFCNKTLSKLAAAKLINQELIADRERTEKLIADRERTEKLIADRERTEKLRLKYMKYKQKYMALYNK